MTAPASAIAASSAQAAPGRRAWLVFGVSFALLLSDYMSRQVLAAVFPMLKAEWALSDGQLGSLGGAVALMVGVLTVPLSLVADRIGRVRAVAIMALVWSLATFAAAFCANYGQLMAARLVLGAGEAAYGSVGLAVVFTYFPARLRATITAAFMAGGVFGSFLGLSLGGLVAGQSGWRAAFAVMAGLGVALTGLYVAFVRERRAVPQSGPAAPAGSFRATVGALFGSPQLILVYAGSGLQLFVMGAFSAWAPSYLNRAHGLPPSMSAVAAAALLLFCGVGMIVCGVLCDRACAGRPDRRAAFACAFALVSFVFLEAAFLLPAGAAQLACAAVGLFCAAGAAGPAGALVADRTPPAAHGAALAVLTLANNLVGLAPGPALTGFLADRIGLGPALQLATVAALLSAAAFGLCGRNLTPKTGR